MDFGSHASASTSAPAQAAVLLAEAAAHEGGAARGAAGASPAAAGNGAPTQLLLFVGEGIRPDAALTAPLAREGLRCLALAGLEQAARAAALARFDIVLVDATLVGGRAARAIETLASAHRCPVVVLADEPDEIDEIVALELGADLYLPRSLSPRRLRAHLGALLRRRQQAAGAAGDSNGAKPESIAATVAAADAPHVAGWTLEFAQWRLRSATRAVRLTQVQTALLHPLMHAAGDVVPAQVLLAALPQREGRPPRALRIHMHRLRQRLRDEGVLELQLLAVRGSGYVLMPG